MELPGSRRKPVEGARVVGRPVQDERITVTLLLRRRSDRSTFPRVDETSRLPPHRRHYLTREEFARSHGAHPDDFRAVRTFARAHDLEVVSESVGPRTVRVAASVGVLSRVFGVTLQRWAYPGGTYRGHTGPVILPRELESVVVGVFGLDDRPQARTPFRRHKTVAPSDVAYTPPKVAAAYDFPSGTDGTGETVGLLELGGGYRPGDLSSFFAGVKLGTPSITAVSVDGAENKPSGNPDGPDGEVELDIEVAGSVAPGARLVVYFAPNTDQGFLDGITSAIHDTTRRPSVLSISWGRPEGSWSAQALDAINGACEDAATMGITVLAAAGDQGATNDSPKGVLSVYFPASSPFVTGCGGTRLRLSDDIIASEVVWNETAIDEGATGGGVSDVFARPSFQNGANVPRAPNGFAGRGVPDVAGDADPTSGYSVLIDGTHTVLGGTSAVAPLWAALVARINQSIGRPVGYLNPRIYEPAEKSTFRDITVGNNDGYSAGPGWDPCTGLGSPDGRALLNALRGTSTRP